VQMTTFHGIAVAITLVLCEVVASSAYPADTCAEGRDAHGSCVNAQLAQSARRSAIIFAQPKISMTALPVLPSLDSLYRYPNQLIPNQSGPVPLGPFILGPGGKVILVP